MKMQPIEYGYGECGDIILPKGAPFDGNPVLIKTGIGIVEAWWAELEIKRDYEGNDDSQGFFWVCYDDAFQAEIDEATHWCPLPEVAA